MDKNLTQKKPNQQDSGIILPSSTTHDLHFLQKESTTEDQNMSAYSGSNLKDMIRVHLQNKPQIKQPMHQQIYSEPNEANPTLQF